MYRTKVVASLVVAGIMIAPQLVTTVHADSMQGLPGTWSGYYNTLNIQPTTTGDILFGYNDGCTYGAWSHTALVRAGSNYDSSSSLQDPVHPSNVFARSQGWDGYVVEANTWDNSYDQVYASRTWQSHFKKYDAASADSVAIPNYPQSTYGSKASSTAAAYSGPYSITTLWSTNTAWYCSKLVGRAYNDVTGYRLGGWQATDITSPQNIYWDNYVLEYEHSLSPYYDGYGVYSKPIYAVTAPGTTAPETDTIKGTKTYSYKGVKVNATQLDAKTKSAIDDKLLMLTNEGKQATDLEFNVNNSKPGLTKYVKEQIKNGDMTKEQAKSLWKLSDTDLQ